MGLIDTHCHLYLEEFDEDQDLLVQQARKSGIEALLLPNVDESTVERMLALCNQHPDFTFPMMGLHPTSVKADYAAALRQIEHHLNNNDNYCAIGEIGIDLYWDKTYLKEQLIVFEEQLRWSLDKQLPVVIHTRDAFPEVLESINKINNGKLTGVFHSFSGDTEVLEEIKKLPNFKIGINGVVTFKNANLADVIRHTSIENIVLETDAPYLSPVPYRGKRNEPAYIWKTAEKVAGIYGLSLEETVEKTRKNALEMFRNINKPV